jgi:hypothetical protein
MNEASRRRESKRAALEARLLEAEQGFVAREEEGAARVAQAGRQAGQGQEGRAGPGLPEGRQAR